MPLYQQLLLTVGAAAVQVVYQSEDLQGPCCCSWAQLTLVITSQVPGLHVVAVVVLSSSACACTCAQAGFAFELLNQLVSRSVIDSFESHPVARLKKAEHSTCNRLLR